MRNAAGDAGEAIGNMMGLNNGGGDILHGLH